MSDQIFINEKKYEAVSIIAQEFSYSTDYITRLAREKKITAVQLGRKWFVRGDSLASYAEVQQQEQQVRQKCLQQHRKNELTAHALKKQHQEKTATKHGQVSRHSGSYVTAVLLGVVLTGMSFGLYLHSTSPESQGQLAAASAAQQVETVTSVESGAEALRVMFSDSAHVHVEGERTVHRPVVSEDWSYINHE